MSRKTVRDLLKHRTSQVPDGEASVAMAREKRPDLIRIGVQLPKVSGFAATCTLRAEPATADTPIIAITSFALTGDDEEARAAGATAYLAKPSSPFELLGIIRKLAPQD